MLRILLNRNYRRMFLAQLVALLGTGLLTMALALSAYNLAGEAAGGVLATALTIKMLVYIGFSPFAVALTRNINRKTVLITSDLLRAGIALCLPFVDAVWQIYILIFILQAASSTFVPTFQAIIPDLLPDEKDYTKALSLTRLAYDLENMASPVIAGLLLTMLSYHWLFIGTAFGFVVSSVLVLGATIPVLQKAEQQSFLARLTRGARIYLSTPRLQGLLALNVAAASVGAMVIVNTVVIVKSIFSGSETGVAITLGAFGLGSMLSALLLPRFLDAYQDRTVMLTSALLATTVITVFGLYTFSAGWQSWRFLLLVWLMLGLAYSAILTPTGRLLKRSAGEKDRPALFAAQFSLSHMCWLAAYPLAGFCGQYLGLEVTMLLLGGIAGVALICGYYLWPAHMNGVSGNKNDHKNSTHEGYMQKPAP